MKKFVIIATGIFLTVCAVFIYTIVPDHGPLYDTVEIDFRTKYPDYELVDCRTGDADMVVHNQWREWKRITVPRYKTLFENLTYESALNPAIDYAFCCRQYFFHTL